MTRLLSNLNVNHFKLAALGAYLQMPLVFVCLVPKHDVPSLNMHMDETD